MKKKCRVVLFLCLFFMIGAHSVFAEEVKTDQMILSWSFNNSCSQTLSWRSFGYEAQYLKYGRYEKGRKLQNTEKTIKALRQREAEGYWHCEAVMSGLIPETAYYYQVGDGNQWGEIKTFTTGPKERKEDLWNRQKEIRSDAVEFLYLGDIQYQDKEKDYPEWGMMLQDIRERNPGISFGVLGGDMVNSSKSMNDWNLFLENASPVFSRIPMMTAIGNHETDVKADYYLKTMALPENGPEGLEEEFYSFDYGNCHIQVLNSSFFMENRKKEKDWQLQQKAVMKWMENDLAKTDAVWKIAVTHHPLYGVSSGDPICNEIRKLWEPVFQQGSIDLILCGHQHVYMRTKEIGGITQIMGNSGKRRSGYFDGSNIPEYSQVLDAVNSNYQIIRIEEKKLSVLSYDEEGQIIDKWVKIKDGFPVLKTAAAGTAIMSAVTAGIFFAVRKQPGRRPNRQKRSFR